MESDLEKLEELKKNRWEEFIKKHELRIAKLPMVSGKKVVPAIWDDRLQNWFWLSRSVRRALARKANK